MLGQVFQLGLGHLRDTGEAAAGCRFVFAAHDAAGAEGDHVRQPFADGIEQGHGRIRDRVVVAPLHFGVIGVRTDQGDLRIGGERQDVPAVLQQDQAFPGNLQRKGTVLRTFHDGRIQVVPRRHIVHLTQFEALGQGTEQVAVEVGLVQQAGPYRLGNRGISLAAFHIDAGAYRCSGGLGRSLGVIMPSGLVEIGEGPAVGNNHSVIAPFATQDGINQVIRGGARLAAEAVVCRHDLLDVGLGDQVLESRQVGLAQVPFRNLGVELVPVGLQAGVDREMLGAGVGFADGRVVRSLEAADHGHAEASGQEGIFAVGLHAAAPARVAEYIDVRSPEGQALINLDIVFVGLFVLDAGLVADGREYFFDQGFVKRGRHADGLREDGGGAVAGDAVQGFVPPVVLADAQARDGRRAVDDQGGFLLEGQPAQQVGSPDLGRKGGVLIGKDLGCTSRAEADQQSEGQKDSFHSKQLHWTALIYQIFS